MTPPVSTLRSTVSGDRRRDACWCPPSTSAISARSSSDFGGNRPRFGRRTSWSRWTATGRTSRRTSRGFWSDFSSNPGNVRLLVLARRTKRQESLIFKALHLGFKSVFRLLTGRVIQTGNYAAYRGWVARHTIFHPHFDLCYSSSLLSLSLPVDYVPCERGRRYAGESRMGYFRLAIHGMRMLMPFMDRIAVRALAAAVLPQSCSAWVLPWVSPPDGSSGRLGRRLHPG